MKIKDNALKQILAEVEGEIATLLKSEKDKLAKAAEESAGGESSPAESAPAESGGGDASAGGPPAPSAPPAGASPSAPPAGPEMGAAPAAPADPAAAGGGMDAGAPPSLEELSAEYAKLPPEELKMHYLAAKTALFQVMGAADGGAGAAAGGPPGAAPSPSPAGAPPAGGPPGASPSAGPAGDVPPAPPAMKGEMPWGSKKEGDDSRASDSDPTPSGTGQTKPIVNSVTKGDMPYASKIPGNDEAGSDSDSKPSGTGMTKPVVTESLGKLAGSKTEKSESELALDELRKGQEQIAKVLEAMLVPERKAWTGTEIQYIKKSEMPSVHSKPLKKSIEEFTVADVNAKLNEVTRNPKLKKSDRERINMFYANQLDLDGIKDLLIEG
jgi:hypothetical protein